MRTLRFIVDKQTITQDPSCDFSGIVPGTSGYLQAEFVFSQDWNGCAKVVAFYSPMGYEYTPEVLKDGRTCMIPAEALAKRTFKIKVIGDNRKGLVLTTNKVVVHQNGGN